MGWEDRGGSRYYYTKERAPDGRVRSVYVGSGVIAEYVAQATETERLLRERERQRHRETFGPIDAALASLLDGERRLRLWRDAYMTATGRRNRRGEWRRRRGFPLAPFLLPHTPPARAETMATKKKGKTPASPETLTPGSTLETATGAAFTMPDTALDAEAERAGVKLNAAIQAAIDKGAKWRDVNALRDTLLEWPAPAFGGFATAGARRAIAGLVCGADVSASNPSAEVGSPDAAMGVALAESEMAFHARELSEDGDGPLVLAACEQAANARAVLDIVTVGYARNTRGEYGLKVGAHWEKRLTSAQLRHVRALATVAALRRAERDERRRMDRHVKREGANAVDLAARELDRRDRRRTLFATISHKTQPPEARRLPEHSGDSVPRPEDLALAPS